MKSLSDMCLRALVRYLRDHPSASAKAIVGHLRGLGYHGDEINCAVKTFCSYDQSTTIH